MTPEFALAFSVTLANPILLGLACLVDITAMASALMATVAVFQSMAVHYRLVPEPVCSA